MTEFLKDFNYVKRRIETSKTLNEVVDSKILLDMFIDKYVGQVSHTDPIFNLHKSVLIETYEKKFRNFSSCI